jgi:hypothetical protein
LVKFVFTNFRLLITKHIPAVPVEGVEGREEGGFGGAEDGAAGEGEQVAGQVGAAAQVMMMYYSGDSNPFLAKSLRTQSFFS